jgi:hypothetical protein
MQFQKSVFFAITLAPTRLVVSYVADGKTHELSLDLPALAGLRLKNPRGK